MQADCSFSDQDGRAADAHRGDSARAAVELEVQFGRPPGGGSEPGQPATHQPFAGLAALMKDRKSQRGTSCHGGAAGRLGVVIGQPGPVARNIPSTAAHG